MTDTRLLGVPVCRVLSGLLACLLLASCRTGQEGPASTPFDLEGFLAWQQQRSALLRTLKSSGTIELREETEGGTTFEDCALELWRDGGRFALRLRKLGERFLWVGSNGEEWWLFELASDPVRLMIVPAGNDGGPSIPSDLLILGPEQLLQMAGLEGLDPDPASCTTSMEDGHVRLAFTDRSAPEGWSRVAWFMKPDTFLPSRIQVLDGTGGIRFEARLSGYEPIRARDQPIGSWPQFARKVRINDGAGAIDVRLFFNGPVASNAGFREAIFDLDSLMKTFRPGSVEYVKR